MKKNNPPPPSKKKKNSPFSKKKFKTPSIPSKLTNKVLGVWHVGWGSKSVLSFKS